MPQRRFWFKRIFFLLATLGPVPIAAWIVVIALIGTMQPRFGRFPLDFSLAPFGAVDYFQPVLPGNSVMVQNHWHWISYSSGGGERIGISIHSVNADSPITNDENNLNWRTDQHVPVALPSEARIQIPYFSMVGDSKKIWLIGQSGEVLEVINGKPVVHTLKYDPNLVSAHAGFNNELNETFLLDEKPSAIVIKSNGQREGYQFSDGTWHPLGKLALLDTNRSWIDARQQPLLTAISSGQSQGMGTVSNPNNGATYSSTPIGAMPAVNDKVTVITINSTPHLFWQTSNGLLYRRGVDFRNVDDATNPKSSEKPTTNDPVGAQGSNNVAQVAPEWTLVSDKPLGWLTSFPIAIEGQPAVVLVDQMKRGHPTATAMRIEDQQWNAFANTELPSTSYFSKTGTRDDGSISYLFTVTIRQRTKVFQIDPTGFHATAIDQVGYSQPNQPTTELWMSAGPLNMNGPWNVYVLLIYTFAWLQISGLMLSAGTGLLMCRDQTDFHYGERRAQLASVWFRAIAKAIDTGLLTLITIGVFRVLENDQRPDWDTILGALRLKALDDENIVKLTGILWCGFFSFVAASFLLAAIQGRWGITPGKWLCGLRVVRTTLIPCGFAKSLYRELLLPLDNLYFLCPVPGIARIAFSEKRQRFGDFAADTIVVYAANQSRKNAEGKADLR